MRGKAPATPSLQEAILAIVEERAPITVRGVTGFSLRLLHHPEAPFVVAVAMASVIE